jgi:hypothetical protein
VEVQRDDREVCGGLVVAVQAQASVIRYRGELLSLCCGEGRSRCKREPEAYLSPAWLAEHPLPTSPTGGE